MPLKGAVEARCPKGCPSEQIEVYSFVRGEDEELRLGLLAGDLNLVLCQTCGQAFYPDATVVYLDQRAALLAFIFPESCRSEEARWRAKMEEDYRRMRGALADSKGVLSVEPALFFGLGAFREALQAEEDMDVEVEVAAHYCRDLGLAPYLVDRAAARKLGLPWLLPLSGPKATPESAVAGVSALLKKNPKLASFSGWLKVLAKSGLPPRAELGRK